nr:MAG TPA: hypothetical protein [Caudoviricetes sp.]
MLPLDIKHYLVFLKHYLVFLKQSRVNLFPFNTSLYSLI